MKSVIRSLLNGTLGLALLVTVIWLGAHLFTANSQWARAIAWLDSDIGDYQRFPAQTIANAGPVFYFRQPDTETQQAAAAALASVSYTLDGQTTTQDLPEFLQQTDTAAFLIIKDDVMLYEAYFNGYDHNSTVTSFSTAKSFDSALVGLAIADGYIGSLEDPLTQYVPELLDVDARYAEIKLRHLVSMASGLRYEEHGLPWTDDAATYCSPNLRAVAVSSPIVSAPGETFHYNNYNPLLIGLVLERATGRPVAEYLQERSWKPLGMEAPASWSLDSLSDGFEKMESGVNGRAIDFAKFGRLYLRGGDWNGTQLIPAAWVQESTRLDTTTDPAPQYQYFWWVNVQAPTHFFAAGKHGQYIHVVPEQNLIMVRFGRTDPFGHWPVAFEALAAQLAGLTPAGELVSSDDDGAVSPDATTTPEIFNPLPADMRAFEAARADLAARLQVDPLSLQRVAVTPTDWPDACLGLPAPGETCAAVVTSGYRVVVMADGVEYAYRTNADGSVARLERER